MIESPQRNAHQELMLKIYDKIPEGLLDLSPQTLYDHFGTSVLIRLRGKKEAALFISCLVHGNEITGFLTIQELLKKYQNETLPRSVLIFVANVLAAKEGRRHLDHQPDFNRIWHHDHLEENKMTKKIIAEMEKTPLFAGVDIHNNTGRNPHYAVTTELNPYAIKMAFDFSEHAMYFDKKYGTVNETLSRFCPTVTLEAGQPGKKEGTRHSLEFVETLLKKERLEKFESLQSHQKLLQAKKIVKIPQNASVGLENAQADICFKKNFDLMNFTEVPTDTLWGWIHSSKHLQVIDEKDREVGKDFFSYEKGEIRNKVPIIPSMLTQDPVILKSDSVGYLLSPYPLV